MARTCERRRPAPPVANTYAAGSVVAEPTPVPDCSKSCVPRHHTPAYASHVFPHEHAGAIPHEQASAQHQVRHSDIHRTARAHYATTREGRPSPCHKHINRKTGVASIDFALPPQRPSTARIFGQAQSPCADVLRSWDGPPLGISAKPFQQRASNQFRPGGKGALGLGIEQGRQRWRHHHHHAVGVADRFCIVHAGNLQYPGPLWQQIYHPWDARLQHPMRQAVK
jgi:hypothetical protein